MKAILFTGCLLVLISCSEYNNQEQMMQAKIDSLQKQLNETYKPGFGEFMSGIQTHHAKLWFAGINSNWPLADFEIHEIEEALEDVQKFCSDRPEIKSIGMITPALDSIKNSIQHRDLPLFKSNFLLLTATCNNCHKATDHAFNVVTVPAELPVVNQDFKPVQ
ncbi:MAG: hypothetical protein ABI675_22425 [Chitinophagaceae bacterium]